ncbi:MAG TPA: Txe/YoeB family addiction module toxin [Flavobacteriaceae bacterium]|nr:Txe/YoeB family addiction module toxin [Flavobacteriaceae bacterium]
MQVTFSPQAKKDFDYWEKTNKAISKKILRLIVAIQQDPFEGIGKPEPLKHQLSEYWSRRINKEHRLVYEVAKNSIFIFSVRGHYQ